MSWVLAAVGMASSVVNNISRQSDARRMAERYGQNMAAVDASRMWQQEQLKPMAAQASEARTMERARVEQNRAATQSAGDLSAAVAGVEGQSVDVVQTEADRTAAEAAGAAERRFENTLLAIEQQSRDINMQHGQQQADIKFDSGRGGLAEVFLGGMEGFFRGRSL